MVRQKDYMTEQNSLILLSEDRVERDLEIWP
jgi:hypothetical protein